MSTRKTGLLGALIVVSAMIGCHSLRHKEPVAPTPGPEEQWLADYMWARAHQDEKACAIFTGLGADLKFPAHDMALLRAVEICPPAAFAGFDRTRLPLWLQDQATDILLKLAGSSDDKGAELALAVEKSKQKIPQSEKVKWMNLAIQRAGELNTPDKLAELNARLYKIAPRFEPEPPEIRYLSVASDWRQMRQFAKAHDYYERVVQSKIYDTEDKAIALKGIRLSFKNARQNDNHLAAAQRLVDFLNGALKANPRSRPLLTASYDAQVYRARALWTLGQGAEAKKIFDRLENKMKGKISLAEIYWLKGRLAEEDRDLASVAKYMDLALKERFNDSDLRDKVMWNAAWNERRRGNLARAIEVFNDIDKNTQIDFTRQRALFWLGKSYAESQHPEEAKLTFTRLVELDPLGYYGLLAHRQLNMPITLKAAPLDPLTAAGDLNLPMDVKVADWLSRLGEKDALTSYLDSAAQSYKKQKEQNDDGWVVLFKYYAKAGLYMRLYESLGALTPERRKSIFEHYPELLFPQPWVEDVRAAAQQFGVAEELLYSITRQESAFDTHARSLADAFGLMQLLPEVAEQLSAKYNIPYTGMDDLYDPKTNLYFGAAHLKELFQRHHGSFILAVASYNANDSAIHNWMKQRFHGDALEFIEDIPYEETRAYVRLVMRNFIFYSLLKSKSEAIAFPDQLLELSGESV